MCALLSQKDNTLRQHRASSFIINRALQYRHTRELSPEQGDDINARAVVLPSSGQLCFSVPSGCRVASRWPKYGGAVRRLKSRDAKRRTFLPQSSPLQSPKMQHPVSLNCNRASGPRRAGVVKCNASATDPLLLRVARGEGGREIAQFAGAMDGPPLPHISYLSLDLLVSPAPSTKFQSRSMRCTLLLCHSLSMPLSPFCALLFSAAERTPVWLMRQAGRYMAAFRE